MRPLHVSQGWLYAAFQFGKWGFESRVRELYRRVTRPSQVAVSIDRVSSRAYVRNNPVAWFTVQLWDITYITLATLAAPSTVLLSIFRDLAPTPSTNAYTSGNTCIIHIVAVFVSGARRVTRETKDRRTHFKRHGSVLMHFLLALKSDMLFPHFFIPSAIYVSEFSRAKSDLKFIFRFNSYTPISF